MTDTDRQLGALAQAARNFIISRSPYDLAALDRLSAEAAAAKRLLPSWDDTRASTELVPSSRCRSCGRQLELRDERGGVCLDEACHDYQERQVAKEARS